MAVKTRKQAYYVITVKGNKVRLYPPKGKKWIVKTYTPSPKTAQMLSKNVWSFRTTVRKGGVPVAKGVKAA